MKSFFLVLFLFIINPNFGFIDSSIFSQETKKFPVPRKVVEKIQSEFPGFEVQSLSNLKEMDQYIINGIVSGGGGTINVSVSITGESGMIVQASVRVSGLDFHKQDDYAFIEKSTPGIPWKRFFSKMDKKESFAGIAFLTFSDLSGEREFTINTNYKKDIKPSILHFDEFGNLIRKEKMKY